MYEDSGHDEHSSSVSFGDLEVEENEFCGDDSALNSSLCVIEFDDR